MKYIHASRFGPMLIGEDKAKDLFIEILEQYLEGDRDDDLTLDFSDVLTIDPGFFTALILFCAESNQFTLDNMRNQMVFSGLYCRDLESLHSALAPTRVRQSMDEIKSSLRKLHEQRQKDVWGNDPMMKNAFDQIAGVLEKTLKGFDQVKRK